MEDVTFDRASADFVLNNDIIILSQVSAEQDAYKLTAAGRIPVDVFRAKESRKNPNAQMDVKVDFNKASLAVFGAHPRIEWGVGDAKGIVTIAGTLDEPQLFGSLAVADGCLKLKDIYTLIDKVNLKMIFSGSRVQVEQISAVLGKGEATISGLPMNIPICSTAWREMQKSIRQSLKAVSTDLLPYLRSITGFPCIFCKIRPVPRNLPVKMYRPRRACRKAGVLKLRQISHWTT